MVYTDNFQKFFSIIDDLRNSGTQIHLYGKAEENFLGAHGGFTAPPK